MSFAAVPAVPEHLVLQGLGGVSSLVGGLLDDPVWSLSDADLLDAVEASSVELARLAAVRLALVGEAHGRGLGVRHGATNTAALVRERLRLHPGEAHRLIGLALALDGPRNATGVALRAGLISVEQAWVIVKAVRALPRDTPPEKVVEAESYLLEMARTFDPLLLGKLGEHLRQQLTVIDTSPGPDPEPEPSPDGGPNDGGPDSDGPDDPPGAGGQSDGGSEEPDPAAQRWLSLTNLPGGLTRISGELDAEAHHRVVHHHGWAIRFGTDRKPELIPPRRIDPDQRPRRNPYSNHIHDLLRTAPSG